MSANHTLKLDDLGEGKVKVSWQMANVARDADPIRFDDPLTVADHVELRGYLAPHLAGFYRQRKHQKIEALAAISPTQPFRVLLVIARPYGERDVPLGTIARPMTEALRLLRPRIELEVLRPPTFDELQKRLNARRGFYNLVHFDGHGVFAAPASGLVSQYAAKAEFGHLVFEKEDGSAHIVNSQ